MCAVPPNDERIYIECIALGRLLKVTAIDPETGTEANVFGPARAREALTRTAVQKLAMVLRKATSE